MMVPESKTQLLADAEEKVKFIQKARWNGFLSEKEKYNQSIAIWADVKKVIETEMKKAFEPTNHIYNLIDSGAR
jgi:DNA-directed RNA polymerase subunit beta'